MSRFLSLTTFAAALLSSACQTTMSVEEAKKVTASFADVSFVPPPRTINDITAILDQEKRAAPPAAIAELRARADEAPPTTADVGTRANLYFRRGLAALGLGRARQAIDDLTEAARDASSLPRLAELRILFQLAIAENRGGSFARSVEYRRQAIGRVTEDFRGWLIDLNSSLAVSFALVGDVKAAEAALGECLAVFQESWNWPDYPQPIPPIRRAAWEVYAAQAQGHVAAAKGQLADAERFLRRAIAVLDANPTLTPGRSDWLEQQLVSLAIVLVNQGRLLEAENEARRGLLSALRKSGRYSVNTTIALRGLSRVLSAQGRSAEAETLARAALEIHDRIGTASYSIPAARAHAELAEALVTQARWREARAEFEAIRAGLGAELPAFLASAIGVRVHVQWAATLLNTGQVAEALEALPTLRERVARLVGEEHRNTAEVRGLLAAALAVQQDRPRALRDFAQAVPLLLASARDADEEIDSRPAQAQLQNFILESYLGLLAEVRGTSLERDAGLDAAAEAFRVAEAVRGRSVQRALSAGAARSAAQTPALADLVRREQDAKKQVSALAGTLANALSLPTDQQNPKAIETLRSQIEALRRAREALTHQIAHEFPAYAQFVNPQPLTVEQARRHLRPGESLIGTYVMEKRMLVWAIPQTGAVAFAAAPVGPAALDQSVTRIRQALNPTATTLGDIPAFDLETAHGLYRQLLEPVKAGWEGAQSLLVVPHGALGQLPLALLVTKPVRLGPEEGVLFSNYRGVPWLVRTHAVTVLPSVTALATLRALPPGDPGRRPFGGFGDPYFSPEQARRAARESGQALTVAFTGRGRPITLRSSPTTQMFDSSQLAMLPRLPDTADEIRSIALALNADLTRDVFIGTQANEKMVKTLELSGYRVIAFATHGLVPGDLDGLTQPALALSAPEVAQVEGDGLLTMEEILGLRLNADWVVLSACNTASGKGAGAEAVSGLGRAFFYAGARALLVSNWPVETTSARALTTELFRRQQEHPGLSRAQALQATMNALIDGPGFVDSTSNTVVFSYAHPIFWAPFTLVGDGGSAGAPR